MTLTPFHPFFQLATKQALDVYAALLKSARSVLYNTGWWDNARMMHLKKLELGGDDSSLETNSQNHHSDVFVWKMIQIFALFVILRSPYI